MREINETPAAHKVRLASQNEKRRLRLSMDENVRALSDRIDDLQEAVVAIADAVVDLRARLK